LQGEGGGSWSGGVPPPTAGPPRLAFYEDEPDLAEILEQMGVTMRSIHRLAADNLRGSLLCAMIAALCVTLAATSSPAQEDAPAAGADVPPAGSPVDAAAKGQQPDAAAATNSDIELFAPRHGASGLWRRANVKTLIANAASKAPGLPAANPRVVPLPLRPGIEVSAVRNAAGLAVPGPRPLGHDFARLTTPAGPGLTGGGSAAGGAGGAAHSTPAPTNAGMALRGTGINGTTMGRMATGPGFIGGPAKDRSGINGTLIRPKQH
jgi:hypothetical protein